MNGQLRLAVLVVTLGAGAPSAPASACGLDGGSGDSFGAAHQGSLDVVFAVSDAIKAGTLAPDTALDPGLVHDRADDRVRLLAVTLKVWGDASSVAVLLVETGTWTRLTSRGGHWDVTEHADKPRPGEAALIVSELALRELEARRMTANKAMQLGLLSVDGPKELVALVRQAYPLAEAAPVQQKLSAR